VTLFSLTRCVICRRSIAEADDWRFVTTETGEAVVCWRCIEKGDIETPVSYEEEDGDE
jgi:hypothetical protein